MGCESSVISEGKTLRIDSRYRLYLDLPRKVTILISIDPSVGFTSC